MHPNTIMNNPNINFQKGLNTSKFIHKKIALIYKKGFIHPNRSKKISINIQKGLNTSKYIHKTIALISKMVFSQTNIFVMLPCYLLKLHNVLRHF